ncbi:protein zer-1 homolog isoform X1 [Homarus americanus]|uniref:Zer-1-like 2 n=1 Tax=Homarus americanus TaxID=6706 RepID=A0A8J5K8C9_HOMAM|nr:protein zer-1 homolog isoform X1 [Homarus americanus]KAG7171076.1 zer-1-like 2 [Homarus americanus]
MGGRFGKLVISDPPFSSTRLKQVPIIAKNDVTEEDITQGLRESVKEPDEARQWLDDLSVSYEDGFLEHPATVFRLVLHTMSVHLSYKVLQVAASTALLSLLEGEDKTWLVEEDGKEAVKVLMVVLKRYISSRSLVCNICLVLCRLQLPHYAGERFPQLVRLLVELVRDRGVRDDTKRKVAVEVLRYSASESDQHLRAIMGDFGVVSAMLGLIDSRLDRQATIYHGETEWMTLWSLTKDVPANCQLFLDGQGLAYVMKYLQVYPCGDELRYPITGLLHDLVTTHHYRPYFMSCPGLITVVFDLLRKAYNTFDVRCHAAQVLAFLVSDGEKEWTVDDPTRHKAVTTLGIFLSRRTVNKYRECSYDSLDGLLALLKVNHTQECQEWAAWSLANLTVINGKKYCRMLEEDGGLAVVEEVMGDCKLDHNTKTLLRIVKKQCRHIRPPIQDVKQHKNKETIGKLEEVDHSPTTKLKKIIKSLEFSQRQLIDLKEKLSAEVDESRSPKTQVQQLSEDNSKLKTELMTTTDQVDYVDDVGRRNNLKLAGDPQDFHEN